MNQVIEKRYAEPVSDEENVQWWTNVVQYMVHTIPYGVYHPQKTNVYDCAAVYNGTSLNQELITG